MLPFFPVILDTNMINNKLFLLQTHNPFPHAVMYILYFKMTHVLYCLPIHHLFKK